jgi:Icc-related predicted phosphoesterase
MIYTEKTYKHLLFCGDIHGYENVIPNYIRDHHLDTCAVFQVGDFGVGFEEKHKDDKWLKYINKRMDHTDSDLFVIRGNHDDPSYFDGNTVLSNVRLMKDYDVININGWNVLGVGGATSVDRVDRTSWMWYKANKEKKGLKDWWKGEVINYNEEILNELRDIDIVITHSAPSFCNPLTKSNLKRWIERDGELDTDIAVERHLLTRMYDILIENNNISEWYYGHFHFNAKSYRDNTSFTAIDINNIVQSNKVYNYDQENN